VSKAGYVSLGYPIGTIPPVAILAARPENSPPPSPPSSNCNIGPTPGISESNEGNNDPILLTAAFPTSPPCIAVLTTFPIP